MRLRPNGDSFIRAGYAIGRARSTPGQSAVLLQELRSLLTAWGRAC